MKFFPVVSSALAIALLSPVSLNAESFRVVAIPELDPKGDVYKTEGPNDPLIYDNAIGTKKMIMVYCDFSDAAMEVDTLEHGKKCLGDKTFETIFKEQSYGKVDFKIDHVHGWRRMPGTSDNYDTDETDTHRKLFVQVFKLYPEVDFLKYDYICAIMPRVGNTAFGEREEIAIPYRDKKIKVAMNLSSANPYTFAHEVGHLMGLPDLYTYEGVEKPKHPAGPWDLMSTSNSSTGFFGWHRHKLGWLDADRKTYLTENANAIRLTSLHAKEGVSMIAIPTDDPKKPSKVFVIEEAQALKSKDHGIQQADGILIYSVDAKITSGNNPVIVYPKEDLSRAPFHPGDTFQHDDAPFTMKVVSKNEDGSYTLDIRFK